jgi:HK97 family phage major capsid protein
MSKQALLRSASRGIEYKDDGGPNLADEIKRAVEPVMTAFEQFKATNDERLKQIEQKGAADPVTEEKLAKIEAKLASSEDLNQKLVAAENQSKQAKEQAEELKTQLEAIQTTLRRGAGAGDDAARTRAERKMRFNQYLRGVFNQWAGAEMNEDQRKAFNEVMAETKALVIANDTTGGYLAPVEFSAEIIKAVTEISAPRMLVRIRTTSMKAVQIPKRTGQFAARRVGEIETRTETTGLAYGMIEITAPEMYAIVDISEQNLEDSQFDLEAEVRMEATEQFAVREGSEWVNGVLGKGEMEGILVNADIGTTNSGTAATVADANGQADGLIALKHAIKTAYARNASWVMNRTTLGSIRKLKDANKQYIWMPGIAMGKPNTIDGDSYTEVPDMPNEGAGAKPVAYGDWMRGYTMVDRVAMQFLRDPYTQADNGLIRFRFRRRVGGQVVLAEAMRTLTCST